MISNKTQTETELNLNRQENEGISFLHSEYPEQTLENHGPMPQMTSNIVAPDSISKMERGEISEREESIPVTTEDRTFLEVKNVSFSVKNKTILKNLDAVFPPGRLVALMGPSGAGKTTFLNVLAGRGRGKIEGELLVNGEKITRGLMRKLCKVVPQHDILEPVLTARETLMYTAELALNVPREERIHRVNEVMETLSLTDCADVICGGPETKGLSGGQLKRVSIAMELLSNPTCLLLDEPTSGLDSKVAADVVDLIKALARGGRTIICTIHQPSFQVFSKFDWLVLLEKGQVVYNGDVSLISGYLARIGHEVPQFVNPADHFFEALSNNSGEESFPAIFQESTNGSTAREDIERQVGYRKRYLENHGKRQSVKGDTAFPTSSASQMWTMFRRSFYVTMKDGRQLRTRIIQLLFIGLILGTIYFRMENTQKRIQDRLSVLFMVVMFLAMSSIMSTALAIPEEKFIMLREYVNGYYGLFSYFLARVSVLLIFQMFYAIIFGSAVYYLIGFYAPAENFFIFVAVLVIVSLISGVAGFTAGILFPTPQSAAAAVPMIVLPMTIFSGLFIPYANIPAGWLWLYYLSFFQYALQVMMVNELHNNYLEACTVEDLKTPGLCPYGACSANLSNPQPCPGDVVLQRLDYDPDDIGMNVGILIGFIALILFVGTIALRRLVRKAE